MPYGNLLIIRCTACIHIYKYTRTGFLSGITVHVLSLSLVFIFFFNSGNKMKHFVCVRDAIFIQFKFFLCLYSVNISSFCLIKGSLSCNPFIYFALLLFFCKGEKILRERENGLPKLRPLSLHALVSKITCVAKDWLPIFCGLNSWSFTARNLKMLLQVYVLGNFIYNSLTRVNHHYHIKNTHFKVIHRITDLFFKIYFLLR